MSGPKTSRYTLTPEQRRILEEQRRVRIERELLAKQLGDARSTIAEADRMIQQIEPLYAEIGADSAALTQAKALREAAAIALAQASSVKETDGSVRLRERNQNLRAATQKLTSTAKAAAAEYASLERTFRAELEERIADGFDAAFDMIGDSSSVSDCPTTKSIQAELDALAALSLTEEQRTKVEMIRAKFAEIEDLDFRKNFYAMTVVPFAKACRAYHAAYAAQGEEYERKCFLYASNAQMLGIAAEQVPFSSNAIAVLDAKIRETEALIRQQEEQAYISRCVDEAMKELGYTVVGDREIVRRNGKRFHNELYLFEEGTAVNVTYSDDGQITMELGGIDREDRIPTEAESVRLAADMRIFCDDYYEMERRLRKKGIITKQIVVLPPEEQYAQIINVSDYNMSVDAAEYEGKRAKKQTAKSNAQRLGEV